MAPMVSAPPGHRFTVLTPVSASVEIAGGFGFHVETLPGEVAATGRVADHGGAVELSIMMITSGVVRQVSLHGDHDQLGPGHLGQRERDLQRASGREPPLHGGPTHPEVLTRLRS